MIVQNSDLPPKDFVESDISAKKSTICAALEVMLTDDAVHELRSPKAGRSRTISGYYDDRSTMAGHCLTLSEFEKVPAVYATLNPVLPDLLARANNTYKKWADYTTTDKDVVRLRRLLVDADPERPAGISSTDEEHDLAVARMREVRAYLISEGWPEPMLCDSGNGGHNIFGIDLENTPENVRLCKDVLEALHARFGDNEVKIDRATFNPSRICKVPGTWARKGDDHPGRPHRLSRVLIRPPVLKVVPRELLERVAGTPVVRARTFDLLAAEFVGDAGCFEAPQVPGWADEPPTVGQGPWTPEKLERWLDDHGIDRWEPRQDGERLKYVLDPCPFNEDHTGRDAAVFVHVEGDEIGKVGFHCFHDGCADKGWKELRGHVEGPRQARQAASQEDADRFEGRLEQWAKARGGDGASCGGHPHASDPEGQYDAKERGFYQTILLAKSIPVVPFMNGVHESNHRYMVESCPCCQEPGIFLVEKKTMRRSYNCGGRTGANWQVATSLWAGARRKRDGFTIRELDLLETPGWQVEGHWPENSLVMIYGASGVCKSFLATDLGLSIASEAPFQGTHRTRRGAVAYVVGEGQGGVKKRIRAWLQKNGADGSIPFVVIPHQFDLANAGESEAREILGIAEAKLGVMPSCFIIDTLNRHFGGANENDTRDMTAFVKSCDILRHESGGSVVVVHHSGRDTSRERGNIAIRNACDVVIACEMYGDKRGVVVSCEKMKDAEEFRSYLLLREVRDIGGGITSLTLKLDDGWEEVKKEAKDRKATWKDDEEVVLHFSPVGEANAWSKTKYIEQVQAELRSRDAGHIGEKRISLAIDTLVKKGKLRATDAANSKHVKFYKAELAPDTGFFLLDLISQEEGLCEMAC